MKQLKFNSTQLLFVRVPMDSRDFEVFTIKAYTYIRYWDKKGYDGLSCDDDIPKGAIILGAIQKSGGIVSTTIDDEVLEGLVLKSEWVFPERHFRYVDFTKPYDSYNKQNWDIGFSDKLESLNSRLQASGIELKEGDKYAVLKIKSWKEINP
jgi:hypothetical protein